MLIRCTPADIAEPLYSNVNDGTFRDVEVYILFAGVEEFKTAMLTLNVFIISFH